MAGKLAGLRSVANEWFGFRKEAINEIFEVNSTLSKHGRYLAAEIEKKTAYRPIIIYTVSVDIL